MCGTATAGPNGGTPPTGAGTKPWAAGAAKPTAAPPPCAATAPWTPPRARSSPSTSGIMARSCINEAERDSGRDGGTRGTYAPNCDPTGRAPGGPHRAHLANPFTAAPEANLGDVRWKASIPANASRTSSASARGGPGRGLSRDLSSCSRVLANTWAGPSSTGNAPAGTSACPGTAPPTAWPAAPPCGAAAPSAAAKRAGSMCCTGPPPWPWAASCGGGTAPPPASARPGTPPAASGAATPPAPWPPGPN